MALCCRLEHHSCSHIYKNQDVWAVRQENKLPPAVETLVVVGQEAAQGWLHHKGLLLGTAEPLVQEIQLHTKTQRVCNFLLSFQKSGWCDPSLDQAPTRHIRKVLLYFLQFSLHRFSLAPSSGKWAVSNLSWEKKDQLSTQFLTEP